MKRILLFISILLFINSIANPLFSQSKKALKLHKKATKKLSEWQNPHPQWKHLGEIKIDTFSIDPNETKLRIQFSAPLSYMPVREENYLHTINSLQESLGRRFKKYDIQIFTDGQELATLIPNYYRKSMALDPVRFKPTEDQRIPIVRRLESEIPTKGMYKRNIALWHSHGWYYEAKLDRWEWQRARLYSTVEDIFPLTFVLPYLCSMLENSGASVFLPRERDTQTHEVIVDKDGGSKYSNIALSNIREIETKSPGFLYKDTLFIGDNPFQMGTHMRYHSTEKGNEFLRYVPHLPKDGNYAVYISYVQSEENISNAKYIVYHTGGKSEFLVNQKIGGGTWIYLGTFNFRSGRDSRIGSVLLSMKSDEKGWITADAVKFGGGMGNVARKPTDELIPNQWSLKGGVKGVVMDAQRIDPEMVEWKISKKPRYMEGSRYYLQYAGAPDNLVYSLNDGKNDYTLNG